MNSQQYYNLVGSDVPRPVSNGWFPHSTLHCSLLAAKKWSITAPYNFYQLGWFEQIRLAAALKLVTLLYYLEHEDGNYSHYGSFPKNENIRIHVI